LIILIIFIDNVYPKGESDGSVLKWDGGKYKCIFYKEGNKDSVFIKYSDYGKNYLNYYKKRTFGPEDDDYEVSRCSASIGDIPLGGNSVNNFWDICKLLDDETIKFDSKMEYRDNDGKKVGDCDKIRVQDTNLPYYSNEYRNIYDHWVTSIVFSCLIIVLEIGLAIFGFLLFKDSTGGAVPLK